ncbi:hypothetical protein C0J45_13302 [Silurus meridionalis]|nr:hypothetical protein C0J45_13302 [Silurus meridionalis]
MAGFGSLTGNRTRAAKIFPFFFAEPLKLHQVGCGASVHSYFRETKSKGLLIRPHWREHWRWFKLFYCGVDGKRNGVGVILKNEYSKSVVELKRVSDRVMNVKLEFEGMMINVISAYAPQVGCEMEEKERFWSELDDVVDGVPRKERLVIGADFNRHVGEGNIGDEEVMGRYGLKERNVEGQMVVDFDKRDRAGKDVLQVRAIKNGDANVLTSEESVLRRWREYFEQLMNKENEREKVASTAINSNTNLLKLLQKLHASTKLETGS